MSACNVFCKPKTGQIRLSYGPSDDGFVVVCENNGSGIAGLADLMVVYLTHKTDSHLRRGRFGRGFKEALCIAASTPTGAQTTCSRWRWISPASGELPSEPSAWRC